jgi:hypothetical protein
MELDYGRGKVLWSQLDLEDHATLDPLHNVWHDRLSSTRPKPR